MSAIAEAEALALKLSARDREKLISKLIDSLDSPTIDDEDDWVEEALRRDKEMEENPETAMTQEEFFAGLREFVRR